VHLDPRAVPGACHDLFFCSDPCRLAYVQGKMKPGPERTELEHTLQLRCPWPALSPAPAASLLFVYGGSLDREEWRQQMAAEMDPTSAIADLPAAQLALLDQCARSRGEPVVRRAGMCEARRRLHVSLPAACVPAEAQQGGGSDAQDWRIPKADQTPMATGQLPSGTLPSVAVCQAVFGARLALPGPVLETHSTLSLDGRVVGGQRFKAALPGGGAAKACGTGFTLADSEMGTEPAAPPLWAPGSIW
jgi:hypothetical protein